MTTQQPEPLPVPGVLNVCWPVDVTGLPAWNDTTDPDNGGYSERDRALAVAYAGMTLRALTGYRVGGCPVTVRPCRRPLSRSTWQEPWRSSWTPVLLAGKWLNVQCGHGSTRCGCTGLAEIRLGPSVTAVTEVKIGGVVLSPDAYRLDRGGILVREDGGVWPLTQNLAAPDTAPGTWSVTTQAGVEVDGLGARVAGVLAQEYLYALTEQDCSLPSEVKQVVRPGLTIDVIPGVFPDGKTGLLEVDSYVRRHNPHALVAPSMVYSVDVQRTRAESRRNAYIPPSDDIDGGAP